MSSHQSRPRWVFLAGLALFAILVRVAPQILVRLVSPAYQMSTVNALWGFTPMLAIGLFAGAFLKNRWHAMGLILGTTLIGDLAILALSGDLLTAFEPGRYLAYPLCTLVGRALDKNRSWGRVQAGSFLSASIFFVLTNFLVWGAWRFMYPVEMYPLTLQGLMACYTAAIPFAKEFIATPLYAGLLFSPLGVAQMEEAQPEPHNELALQ